MKVKSDSNFSILECIGNTPLVKLSKIVPQDIKCDIYVKCEFMNPTGSIKDRIARYIIENAESKGLIKPGGTIVECTSGNTGLGLAMVAAVKGYKCIFTIPDKMSTEKISALRAFGAEVVITPADADPESEEHYINVAKNIAASTPNCFYVDQYNNPLNTEAHEVTTGPEIWEQTQGKLTAFVAGAGTGGTLSGIARFLKKQNDAIRIIGVDPIGSIHADLFLYGEPKEKPQQYKLEGIGSEERCEALDFSVIDEFVKIADKEAFVMARRLLREEGLFCGGSSGANVAVALQVARELNDSDTVVTVLPDSGSRYLSKCLSDDWMKENGFL